MACRIGINGFGRIGRMVIRVIASRSRDCGRCGATTAKPPIVTAVNDPFMATDHMRYLLKYDSTHGPFTARIDAKEKALCVDGESIMVSNEKDPKKIPWSEGNCNYVLECTGLNLTTEKASQHIRDTVKKVVISAPSKDTPMFVVGVNHTGYKTDMTVVSNASCTTNCLAPMVKVLHDNFKIEYGLMTTIHAVTASQMSLDGPKKTWRLGRGAYQSIIPATTGAAKAIGKIIPDLNGKLTGTSCRVPVPTGSLVDLTVQLNKKAPYDDIKKAMKEASECDLKGILRYTDEPLVSSDIIGDCHSSIFDASAGIALTDCFVKLMAWYDNEWGYTCRLVDLLTYMSAVDCSAAGGQAKK